MRYEFRCVDHPEIKQIVYCPASLRDTIIPETCQICGQKFDQELKGHGGGWFNFEYGKETGAYDYDYGKKATWDLTPKGKMDRLKKEGIIRDPFDYGPPPNDHVEV